MPDYLLSTQALLDRLSGKPEYRIIPWLNRVHTTRTAVWISVLSIGVAKQQIGQTGGMRHSAWKVALDETVRKMSDCILPVEADCMQAWADLLNHPAPLKRQPTRNSPRLADLDDIDRLVVATALARQWTLIERSQPYQSLIPQLQVETLGE